MFQPHFKLVSLGNNFIAAFDGAFDALPSDRVGTRQEPLDPLLGPDHAPRPESPLRDGGDTALLLAACPDCAFDVRGGHYPRVAGASVDIGAFEYPAGPAPGGAISSADSNGDGVINLEELLRVIQLYNAFGYGCDHFSEDGFAPVPGATNCHPHSADYAPRDWVIALSELLRVIQLYNSGAYHPCAGGEDGFCPGPATD
jgi:hypothetical protein